MNLKMTRFRLGRFVMENLRDPLTWRVSPLRLIPLWFRGFTTEHILLFGLNGKNWRDYPKDVLRYRVTNGTNRHVWPVLHDKLFFDGFMKGRLGHLEALFLIVEGHLQDLAGGWSRSRLVDEVVAGGSFVIKPARGGMGMGLLFVRTGGAGLEVNGRRTSRAELEAMLAGLEYHLGYRFVEQHSVLGELYPAAVNTLRVTAYVGVDGRARLFAPVLRIGSAASAPIDNFCKGGFLAAIDEGTGECLRALRRNERGMAEGVSAHPESGAALVGVRVPFWADVRQAILAFHEAFPAFDLVGWDVLIGPDGFHVIEGNHNPDLRLPLLFESLAKNAPFRRFLEARGLVAPENARWFGWGRKAQLSACD
jgi:hypothetical protein